MPTPYAPALCLDCGRPSKIGENGEDVCHCGGRLDPLIDVRLSLPAMQALALAQFVKRVGWSEFRGNAVDEREAYVIRDAVDALAKALAEQGYAPR